VVSTLVAACANQDTITDVYVQGLNLGGPENCHTSTIDVSYIEVKVFFSRAKKAMNKDNRDRYTLIPCHILITLEKNNNACEWEILNSSVG